MSGRAVGYFYIITIQLTNPAGGTGRIISDSETFIDNEDLTQEQKFGQTLKAVSSRTGIWLLKGQSNRPDFTKFSVLFYQCDHDLGPVGGLSMGTFKRMTIGEQEV
jgi:hypothetical protein